MSARNEGKKPARKGGEKSTQGQSGNKKQNREKTGGTKKEKKTTIVYPSKAKGKGKRNPENHSSRKKGGQDVGKKPPRQNTAKCESRARRQLGHRE